MNNHLTRLTDIDVLFVFETDLAVLVKRDEDAPSVWLPKSQIEMVKNEKHVSMVTVTLPERLAIEKGLA